MSPRPASATLKRSVPIFAALGDATRLEVIARLSSDGPLSITALTEGSEVTRQAVTKHLEVLATAGLVRDFRQGRERMFELRTRQLEEALERLRKMVEE